MIDNLIVIFYLLALVLIGFYTGGKLKSLDDFSISNQKYGIFMVFATLSSSFIGGGFSSGNASAVFDNGIGNTVALWGFSLGTILVGKYIVPKIGKFNGEISAGGIMGRAYGLPARVITGILSMLFCAAVLGVQVLAIGLVFQVFLGTAQITGILIGISIVVLYSTFGGMKAVILADSFQFTVLALGIPVLVLAGIHSSGGLSNIISGTPPEFFNIFNKSSPLAFISLFLTMMIGEILVPPYVQRLMIGKSLKVTSKATVYSGFFSIFFLGLTGFAGLIALHLAPSIDSSLAMPFLIKEAMPTGIRGFLIAAVVAMVTSSADSYLNSASVGIVNDVLIPLTKSKASDRKKLFVARLVNFLTGVLAVVFAVLFPNIIEALLASYVFWCPIILVPLCAALLGKKAGESAFYAGAFGGLCGVCFCILYEMVTGKAFVVDKIVMGFLLNLLFFTTFSKTSGEKI